MKKYKIIIILNKANETIYTDNLEKLKNAKYHDYTKAINYYKEKAIEELKEL